MYWIPVILILPYFFLLLKIYRDLLTIKPYRSKSLRRSLSQLLLPAGTRRRKFLCFLTAYPARIIPTELFEVIIVDDNSDDKTYEAAESNTGSLRISVIRNRGRGKKEAIRSGIDAASGRLIITTDADCTMGTVWIKTIASFFDENRPDIIICPVQIRAGQEFSACSRRWSTLAFRGLLPGLRQLAMR